jgi:hypothetical protein
MIEKVVDNSGVKLKKPFVIGPFFKNGVWDNWWITGG